jgi:hypothetical protein
MPTGRRVSSEAATATVWIRMSDPGRHVLPAPAGFATIAASLTLAACGSSSTSTSRSTTNKAAPVTTASAPASKGRTSAITTGPVRGKLVAQNHAPTVGKKWPYSVTVTDASGHPLNGRVDIEFVFAGQVVGRDTPPTHPVKNGRWHDLLTFPPASLGQPLVVRAVVHTSAGSITLDWPINTKR